MCETALPSCTGSAGVHTANLKAKFHKPRDTCTSKDVIPVESAQIATTSIQRTETSALGKIYGSLVGDWGDHGRIQISTAHKQQLSADQRRRNEVEGFFGSGKRNIYYYSWLCNWKWPTVSGRSSGTSDRRNKRITGHCTVHLGCLSPAVLLRSDPDFASLFQKTLIRRWEWSSTGCRFLKHINDKYTQKGQQKFPCRINF